MPTGVPANQLNQDEKFALMLAALEVLVEDTPIRNLDRRALGTAYWKLHATYYAEVEKSMKPKRKVKKGSDKPKAE